MTGKHWDLLPAASGWGKFSCFSKLIAEDYLCFVKRPDSWCSWKCLLFLPADAFRLATGLFCGLCCWVCCELTDIDKDLEFGRAHKFDSSCCEPQRPQQPVAVAMPRIAVVTRPEIKMVEEARPVRAYQRTVEEGVPEAARHHVKKKKKHKKKKKGKGKGKKKKKK